MNECFSRKKEIRIIWNNQRKEEKMNEPRKIQKKLHIGNWNDIATHTHTHAHMLMFRIFFEILKSKSIIFHFNSMILNHIYNDDDDYDEASAFFHQNNKKRKLHLN